MNKKNYFKLLSHYNDKYKSILFADAIRIHQNQTERSIIRQDWFVEKLFLLQNILFISLVKYNVYFL